MEQKEQKLEIETSVLLKVAEDSSQHVRAFYFAQRAFYQNPDEFNNIRNLIRLSSNLGLPKTVKGLSLLVKSTITEPSWREQLGHWEKAKLLYLERLEQRPEDSESFKGYMRFLKHQRNWPEIISKIDLFNQQKPEVQKEVVSIILSALQQQKMWDEVERLLPNCPRTSVTVLIKTFLNFLKLSPLFNISLLNWIWSLSNLINLLNRYLSKNNR